MKLQSDVEHTDTTIPKEKRATVLVVDDEPAICWAFERMLREEGHDVLTASSAEEGLKLAGENRLALVLLDIRLPKEDGLSAMPKFLVATDNAPIVVMTAFGDLETAVGAIEKGASDYLIKPFHLDEAILMCRKTMRKGHSQSSLYNAIEKSHSVVLKIIGRSPAIQKVFRQIALVANSDLSVLITGETGTGKELVAEAIHRHSRRRNSPYFAIAPVALNLELIESELFGHVKGAFTDAREDRSGFFEQAEGGSVLLDEIGDLPMSIQVKLLRILEQGDYSRVGDTKLRRCNVRILAATNCDLAQRVREGKFREDLFYRLNGLHIQLPPLRERLEDLELLCEHFLQRIEYPKASISVDSVLLSELANRPWYGNVREFRNAVEHAAITARGRPLMIEDFPTIQPINESGPAKSKLDTALAAFLEELIKQQEPSSLGLHDRLLSVVEPAMLQIVLRQTGGNRQKAAEVLGIHRSTLRERLRHYDLDA